MASKTETLEALLAQKRVYQKHLRNLQQTSLARDILKGTWIIIFVVISPIPVPIPVQSLIQLNELTLGYRISETSYS